ncbi:hypothetical protein [Clostridium uliginosum]|uniref:Uncharacterized protein n=1 Tax=Clostridium uliginosum TaxID=119641 RepID=A0A1I1RTU2_9CLOT|nr:hypothetical protein [Clostridium uliginosum]SFD37665.1 hypothetical protein SAMN05421842_13824 [Clostridium uliginosum]
MWEKRIFSTGVLTKEPNTVTAVVNIVNLDMHNADEVTVEVWNWSSFDNPVKIPVLIGANQPVSFPFTLQPNHLAVMFADLNANNVTLYEIRISYSRNRNIIANCFGRSAPPSASQEGNTVLQHELVELEFRKPCVPMCYSDRYFTV